MGSYIRKDLAREGRREGVEYHCNALWNSSVLFNVNCIVYIVQALHPSAYNILTPADDRGSESLSPLRSKTA